MKYRELGAVHPDIDRALILQRKFENLLDFYRIGPGPSSSHTVGPMRAAAFFRERLLAEGREPARIHVDLKGSLSATGRGHGTDRGVLGGLLGWAPDRCDVDALRELPDTLDKSPVVPWGAATVRLHAGDIAFVPYRQYADEVLPHPNTLTLAAYDAQGRVLLEETWCSPGGGFVRTARVARMERVMASAAAVPSSSREALAMSRPVS